MAHLMQMTSFHLTNCNTCGGSGRITRPTKVVYKTIKEPYGNREILTKMGGADACYDCSARAEVEYRMYLYSKERYGE